jgi:NAD(P)-dependent dehydrogenase (short-subunit alcohol dehydrogenase family)
MPDQTTRAALVTGSSSGIGRAIALRLAQNGFLVFASVRKERDAQELRNLGNPDLVPVCPLDLTRLDQVGLTQATVSQELSRRGIEGLFALINNAGAGTPAPIEIMDLEELRTELTTRVLGGVAMVQAFLPMIRQAKGRLVWIVTPAIIPTPYVASIHSSDFAVNCLARTLEIELKPWRIPNIMIRCGGIRTPAGLRTTSDLEANLHKAPPERSRLYESRFRAWGHDMTEFDRNRTDPEAVAELVLRALRADKPRRRYSIGHMAWAAAVLEALPQNLADAVLKSRF